MKIFSMNCRGVGQPGAVHELRNLIQMHHPKLVFLSETRLFDDSVELLKRKLGFPNGIGVGSMGRGGGLALLWTNDIEVYLNTFNKAHIDVSVRSDEIDMHPWRFTGFYGEPRKENRHLSWSLLHDLNTRLSLPWLCAGDFNEILDVSEQFGGVGRTQSQIEKFKEVVEECGLHDLGFVGLPYTWDNRQEGSHNIKVRLDRAFANDELQNIYKSIKVVHIQTTESDHCGLIIELMKRTEARRETRPFRYENMWRRHEGYNQFVEDSWRAVDTPQNFQQLITSLSHLQSCLRDWDKNVFGSVRKQLNKKRKELEKIRSQSFYRGPNSQERRLMRQIAELLNREEIMEKQRSRIQWLSEGDRNTSFFQAKAKGRAKQNKISCLQDADGSLISDQAQIEATAINFYNHLFKAEENTEPEEVLKYVPRKVSDEMNESLGKPYTTEEVSRALFMMGPSKAPGQDGFTAGFYQAHWDLLGPAVTKAVLEFLNGGQMPRDINKTILVLIPKIKNAQHLSQFRPISLCNVIYKICSKVIANRLRELLGDIISEEQSAFVPGRLITDNAITAYECIHYLKRKKGKSGGCALKLDMAKAYDRVDWRYLKGILQKLGFHEKVTSLIMSCVTSVSFSVRVNGVLSEEFKPTRGIRQGDPISPYLFLLCAEGLSCMLKYYGPQYLSRGVRVSTKSPWVNHLLFADDCIIFAEASKKSADRLKNILDSYSQGSGQLVNKEKSAIFFSKNSTAEMKKEVHETLHISTEALVEKYLGLPTAIGRSTTVAFEHIPGKIREVADGWSAKNMSSAARETLIKSVAQAIPTYSMSCFKLATNTCKKITTSISNFWWGGSAVNKKIHWLQWKKLTQPKIQGGMGFRDMQLFNLALLGKQSWRLMEKPESLCARVLKGRYYPHETILTTTRKKHASKTWRAILAGRDVLRKGLIRRIGNGQNTNIWNDKWIPDYGIMQPVTKGEGVVYQQVSELINEDGEGWNENRIRDVFWAPDAEAIMRIPLGRAQEDFWSWAPEKKWDIFSEICLPLALR